MSTTRGRETHTRRDRQSLLFTCSVGEFGQSSSLGKRGRHVEDTEDGIECGRVETGEGLLEDVEGSKEAVVTDDIGLDRSGEVDSGRVVAVDGTGDVGNGDVGSEVGG